MQTFLIIFNTIVSVVIVYKWVQELRKDIEEMDEQWDPYRY
jgi:hypothetical protein